MESNISKDHIALEAMKVIMAKTVEVRNPFWERVKRFFGLSDNMRDFISYDADGIAAIAYEIADKMIEQREVK